MQTQREEEKIRQIKEVSGEMVKECNEFIRALGDKAWALQRTSHSERREAARTHNKMQENLKELKRENERMLDERERALEEMEREQEELESIKTKLAQMDRKIEDLQGRKRAFIMKRNVLQEERNGLIKAIDSTIEKRAAMEDEILKRVCLYKSALGLEISVLDNGSIKFGFQGFRAFPLSRHSFVLDIENCAVSAASVDPSLFVEAVDEFAKTKELFVFLADMRRVFLDSLEREKENAETLQ
jgi:Chromosome segregation protein Spc25